MFNKTLKNEVDDLRRTITHFNSSLENHKNTYHRSYESYHHLDREVHSLIKQVKELNTKFQMLMDYLELEIVSQPDRKIVNKNDTR